MNEERIAGLTKDEFTQKNTEHSGRLKILSATVDGQDIDIIVRPMTRAEYDKSQQDGRRVVRENTSVQVLYANTVRTCLVAPSVDEFNAALEKYPAIAAIFADKLGEMAGAEAEVREKTFL